MAPLSRPQVMIVIELWPMVATNRLEIKDRICIFPYKIGSLPSFVLAIFYGTLIYLIIYN